MCENLGKVFMHAMTKMAVKKQKLLRSMSAPSFVCLMAFVQKQRKFTSNKD